MKAGTLLFEGAELGPAADHLESQIGSSIAGKRHRVEEHVEALLGRSATDGDQPPRRARDGRADSGRVDDDRHAHDAAPGWVEAKDDTRFLEQRLRDRSDVLGPRGDRVADGAGDGSRREPDVAAVEGDDEGNGSRRERREP